MEIFAEFLSNIENEQNRTRTEEVLNWVKEKYPHLVPEFKWNQPNFTDHGTFIIAFSVSKQHLAFSPETAGILHFSDEITQAGYTYTKMLVRFPWNKPVDYALLEKIIDYNIADKAECTTFWRK